MADLLIVDDDVDTADLLSELLHFDGYDTRVANDGSEALSLLDARKPDLVVLDVEMPKVSGPEMAHQMFMRNHGLESVPIILCSGMLDLGVVAASVGTRYYLSKPYALDSLVSLIGRALRERAAPDPPPEKR
ncbi:Two-component response regulator [Labilithrix luteola]|uniref:Two-component response regulator n=1 Tax=Labilithrix luteola TaxID=1391654 RepID=A0A0K1Q9V7_9BACT|nr:response regulator [Labilithrix luteola]AKV02195.1 Two-component response regulator [Labilithrix luteola]